MAIGDPIRGITPFNPDARSKKTMRQRLSKKAKTTPLNKSLINRGLAKLGIGQFSSGYAPELTTSAGPESQPKKTAKEKFDSNPARKASVARKKRRKKRRLRAEQEAAKQNPQIPTPTSPEAGLPSIPRSREVTPEMRRAALQIFESQQGAGQVPYYMAAARNQFNPNMSPAFQYAAQNYDVLGGAQRLAPRPMEMMSVAERQQINRMAEGMANPPQIGPPRFGLPGIPPGFTFRPRYGGLGVPPVTSTGGDTPVSLPRMPMPSPQQEYQQGMDMVMRGGGKGAPATGQQFMPPQGLAALLAQRFGGFGGQ
tara:strand:+ start:49 stop:981 length:933 start_codon:yes stop_codon:yes gene_type:complete